MLVPIIKANRPPYMLAMSPMIKPDKRPLFLFTLAISKIEASLVVKNFTLMEPDLLDPVQLVEQQDPEQPAVQQEVDTAVAVAASVAVDTAVAAVVDTAAVAAVDKVAAVVDTAAVVADTVVASG